MIKRAHNDRLRKEAVEQIMIIEYEKQFSKLDDDEKQIIVQSGIRTAIMGMVDKLDNARQIKRIIREALSAVLIREIL